MFCTAKLASQVVQEMLAIFGHEAVLPSLLLPYQTVPFVAADLAIFTYLENRHQSETVDKLESNDPTTSASDGGTPLKISIRFGTTT